MLTTLPTAPAVDALAGPDVCPACSHSLAAHDAISSRWCAATSLGIGDRDCLCSPKVTGARVLRHY